MNNNLEPNAASPHQSPPPFATPPVQHNPPNQNSALSAKGRFSRYSYFGWNALLTLFMLAFVIIGVLLSPDFQVSHSLSVISWLILIAGYGVFIYLAIIVMVRRLHDLDRSGWFALLSFVPLINVALSIYMMCFKGTDGENRFGAPRPALGWEKFMAWAQLVILTLIFAAAIGAGIVMDASQSPDQLQQRMDQAL